MRALAALVELGEASPLPGDELRRLLEDVAGDPRGALEALEWLDAPPDGEAARSGGSLMTGPRRVCGLADWHPGSHLEDGDEWVRLDACDTLGTRRRWYGRLMEAGEL